MRRRDCKDPGYAHRCCTLAFTFIPSSHSHSSFFPLHIAPSSYPNDDTDYPPPRFPDAVHTSVPVSASTSTSIALQPGAFTFFSLSCPSFCGFVCVLLLYRFFPSFLWLVGMGLAAVLARCRRRADIPVVSPRDR
ncbi:hypothetical protein B0H14DRAFT_2710566 [Mycena olivaceomarginata]|nr:hypothetical protein B0H14DRAFT_2710566 [Mycena olivaceomarginata]